MSDQSPKGAILTVSDFAKSININTHTVRLYIENGMPVFERGGKGVPHKLDLADAWKWAMTQRTRGKVGRPPKPINENDPKRRAEIAQAEKRELELAKMRGELVYIEDARILIGEVLAGVKQDFFARYAANGQLDIAREIFGSLMDRMANWIENVPNAKDR